MKKLALFLILCLVLILLISCGKSTSDSSSITNCTTSGSPSSVLPSSSTKPQDTEAPVTTTSKATETTSTSKATETQPISTSEAPQTEPTVIRAGFLARGGLVSCPLFIAYEMPRSCPLSEETVTITLYFGILETWFDGTLPEDYYKLYLLDGKSLFMYPLREVSMTEISNQNYICSEKRTDNGYLSRSFSHSETFEIPLSIFSEEKGDFWNVEVEYIYKNEWGGTNSLCFSYKKINGETIVFYPHHITDVDAKS